MIHIVSRFQFGKFVLCIALGFKLMLSGCTQQTSSKNSDASVPTGYEEIAISIEKHHENLFTAFNDAKDAESADRVLRCKDDAIEDFNRLLVKYKDLPKMKGTEAGKYFGGVRTAVNPPASFYEMEPDVGRKLSDAIAEYMEKLLEVLMKFGFVFTPESDQRGQVSLEVGPVDTPEQGPSDFSPTGAHDVTEAND